MQWLPRARAQTQRIPRQRRHRPDLTGVTAQWRRPMWKPVMGKQFGKSNSRVMYKVGLGKAYWLEWHLVGSDGYNNESSSHHQEENGPGRGKSAEKDRCKRAWDVGTQLCRGMECRYKLGTGWMVKDETWHIGRDQAVMPLEFTLSNTHTWNVASPRWDVWKKDNISQYFKE